MQAATPGIRSARRGSRLIAGAYAVGIDLAWSDRHPSALCIADATGALITELMVSSDDEIIDAIRTLGDGPVTVAIDAPLVVPNDTGRRPCEAELQAEYGSRHAGPHPSNRQLLTRVHGRIRGEDLLARIRAHGFALPGAGQARTILECYPHPAIIEMFGLGERLRYKAKRGMTVADRRKGLATLATLVESLEDAEPRLVTPRIIIDETVRGRAVKTVEDTLDARICAWVAALWSRRPECVRCFGDPAGAHIVVPRGTAHATG